MMLVMLLLMIMTVSMPSIDIPMNEECIEFTGSSHNEMNMWVISIKLMPRMFFLHSLLCCDENFSPSTQQIEPAFLAGEISFFSSVLSSSFLSPHPCCLCVAVKMGWNVLIDDTQSVDSDVASWLEYRSTEGEKESDVCVKHTSSTTTTTAAASGLKTKAGKRSQRQIHPAVHRSACHRLSLLFHPFTCFF